MSEISPLWDHLGRIGLASPQPTALYFADPMCSWCWGFSPVIGEMAVRYRDHLPVFCVMGGLRAGKTVPTDRAFREEIFHHWRAVHGRSRQPFRFEGALPDGFVYDTEPACRAVVSVLGREPDRALAFLHALQRGFYAEGRDITRTEVLAGIAESEGLDRALLLETFGSPETRARTAAHFRLARDFGIRGFPAVMLVDATTATLLTSGYATLETLAPTLEDWLRRPRETRNLDS